MNIRKFIMIVVGILIISGCGQKSLNERHQQYLTNKGWKIKGIIEVETFILEETPDELLSGFEANSITIFNEYLGKEVTQYIYELKEKDIEGKRLNAIIYEEKEKIIGGHGLLPSWTLGLFNLDDKQRLINEGKIKQ
ncbi:DUF4830 domain-containing protein [Bacillus sp. FJAT-49711]|uniref:DUF4830 domain-containing protein n=1 Tax=Bacillus sp. FJAT-49711 TaxID=2833585 RepID=UPI001BC8D2D0|nr:DUF4830 domain-containing protein [Bacillus sp. FJAT-49711]MBS4217484.1 DUF4830 domain-containing protein [Bacillus sp. FJAT-49711]